MKKFRLIFVLSLVILSLFTIKAQIRTYDGYGTCKDNPTWGMANDTLINNTPVSFADGISEPNGKNRKNPRIISNTVFAQDKFYDQ